MDTLAFLPVVFQSHAHFQEAPQPEAGSIFSWLLEADAAWGRTSLRRGEGSAIYLETKVS